MLRFMSYTDLERAKLDQATCRQHLTSLAGMSEHSGIIVIARDQVDGALPACAQLRQIALDLFLIEIGQIGVVFQLNLIHQIAGVD